MHLHKALLSLTLIGSVAACGGTEDEPNNNPDTTDVLQGLTVLRQGSLQAQDGPATSGSAYIAQDASQTYVVLGNDFSSGFDTGTVTVFLAKGSENLDAQRTIDDNQVSALVGRVNENGGHRFELPSGVSASDFDYVIIWCETAAINFAAAELATTNETVLKSGSLVDQDGPATSGTVSIVDGSLGSFVVLGEDFSSDFATGTVTVFLAKGSDNLDAQRTADASSVSELIGRVNENGAHRFEIPAGVDPADFSYAIIWCETAAINFAAAQFTPAEEAPVRTGSLTDQDGPATSGAVSIVAGPEGRFLTLGDDFASDFATGTVTVFLASSDANLDEQRSADAASVSPLIGRVNANGAHRFEIPANVDDAQFSHVIIWCETAAINFAAGMLGASN